MIVFMWDSNVNKDCVSSHSVYYYYIRSIGNNIPVSNHRLISVEKNKATFKNTRRIVPIIRHLQFHKTILKSNMLVYYCGYFIVPLEIFTMQDENNQRQYA